MFKELKNRWHHWRSRHAPSIYAIVRYAKWTVSEYKFAGKWEWDERTREWVPLVYHYNDHNGEYETYSIAKITNTTSGAMLGWSFNKERAESLVYQQRILEEVNYGKIFNAD